MNQYHSISRDPTIMAGKPCIKGTRVPVYLIVEKLGAGYSLDQLSEAYPQLTRDNVLAALAYAADYMSSEGTLAA
jgi:uncharacterized protein (DUF433 family)